jgi:pimeloyl-ACP methyl ester carboxylesterase/DNA-binding winged helix-turn-helix (wHTH) protein
MRLFFSDCEIDLERHTLSRQGREVHVEPQVFDLIACVAKAGGALVTYDELIAEIWAGRIVSDATVAARISAARSAIGDDGKRQEVIRTIPRRGIQMVADVTELLKDVTSAEQDFQPNTRQRQSIRYTQSKDGIGIAWAKSGEGTPLLRAGHWMSHLEHDWTSTVWQPLLNRLSSNYSLVRYDPRGTGLSDRTLNSATVEELTDDLEAVADAAGLDKFPIFASSQSVPVALTFAARHPQRVTRLVLLNGLVKGSTARGEVDRTEALLAMIRTGWGEPQSAFMRALSTVFVPNATREEIESLMEMQAVSATGEIAAQLRQTIGAIDVSNYLSQVVCPTLIIHAKGDQVQSAEESRRLARALQDAEFVTLNSDNHILVPSDPTWVESLELIERFLSV